MSEYDVRIFLHWMAESETSAARKATNFIWSDLGGFSSELAL